MGNRAVVPNCRKFTQKGIVFVLLVLLVYSVGICQPKEPQLTAAQQRLQTKITYSCRSLPIDTVLMQLAEQAEIDIIKSPKVTGEVTVKVTDVPLSETLNNILAAHGYSYIATENMIRVVPLDEVIDIREKVTTKIYKITYADIRDVSSALSKFISRKGEIAYNKGTSHLIVTDSESKIKAIDSFIEEIDRITPQVLVEVRIYDVTSTDSFELSSVWEAGLRTNTFTRTDEAESETDIYNINRVITDDPEEVLDGKGDVTTQTITQAPATTGWGTEKTDSITKTIEEQRRKPFVDGSFDKINGGTLSFGVLNDSVNIDIALNILHTQLESKLLANPRLLVLDNETATFKSVSEYPYEDLSETSQGGSMTTIKFKDVGVELEVTPHIARNGMIRLHIIPKFSVKVSEEFGIPVVDSRETDTIALVKDGQTIVIGGLRKREKTKDIYKVPVLGDIPLVGGLFQSETESVVTNELVVFITTKIVTDPVLTEIEKERLEETKFSEVKVSKTKIGTKDQVKHEADLLDEAEFFDVEENQG